MSRITLFVMALCCGGLVIAASANEGQNHSSGESASAYKPLDDEIIKFMQLIDAKGGTVAVSRHGKLHYSRGYGHFGHGSQQLVPPDALMRIASVTKPFTEAVILTLIRDGKLTLQTKAFPLLGLRPPDGHVRDPRIMKITIEQLLQHKGGWDRDTSFDPMFSAPQIREKLRIHGPVTPTEVVRYMMSQPLQFEPGEKVVYSNFGYCVLGRVIERVTHKPYFMCVQEMILAPLGITDILMGRDDPAKRSPREVHYPIDERNPPMHMSMPMMDSHGGLVASAAAVCRFLDNYWISGEPRHEGEKQGWTFFGSLPGTTSLARQRNDGYNVVVLLNNRRENHSDKDNDVLFKAVDKAMHAIHPGHSGHPVKSNQ